MAIIFSTSSSAYTLGSIDGSRYENKRNAVTEIKKHGSFTVNIPTEELLTEVEIAGCNSRKGQVCSYRSRVYNWGDSRRSNEVTACPVSIECQLLDL